MKVSDLIDKLEGLKEKHGDLTVRLNCDHGQFIMSPTYVGIGYIESLDEWLGESIHEDNIDAFASAAEVIVLEAY